ncbi:CaiB/BaiF CoA transferase family protein [Henriciella litoralis]|uniref:CaiB/BaiF CoA transferase family protein n=1 Tax=Henriciella litoralis TaxID=568102 RepID=UPI000A0031DA|nr:CaiB/BaiF CoA-transferase family protein [Henriciella litoralis]
MDIKGYPLEGLKVLDLSRVLAGPFATRMLSDLGADVIKIEPPEGDVTRHFGKTDDGVSGFYLQQNVGKRNICIDLKADGARELVLDLCRKADVLVENFRPGVMKRFGLDWESVHAANPKLVMLSISGFGQTGPESGRAAYAPVVHAETGLISRQADMSGGPAYDLQYSLADSYSSLHGLVGLLAALRVADQTGIGQHVDIAMINVVHATDDYAHWALDNVWPKPAENLVWDAPDGKKILISSDMKWIWRVFSTKGGVQDPTPDGAELETKVAARHKAVTEHIRSYPSFDALTEALDRMNLAWGLVRKFGEESYAQKSVGPNGILVDVVDDKGNPRRTVQSPYRFSASKSGIETGERPPKRGEHNVAALEDWLGLNSEDVKRLTDAGVLLSE